MSFEEKSVWIQLVGMLLALGAYFLIAGQRAMPAYAAVFMVAVGAMVIYLIVAHTLAAIVAKPEQSDERDKLIAWRSEHNSSWLAAVGILAAVTCLVFEVQSVWTANILLLSLALSQVVGFVLQITYYRRGV